MALLTGGTLALPLPAVAQQNSVKLPTIGVLGSDASVWRPWTTAFAERLRELGWVEGRTIAIEYRWSQPRPDYGAEIAAEFVRLKVDVIVTSAAFVPAFKRATAGIPIVFALSNDPVGVGIVESLARPGGNVTGLSTESLDLAGKRVELLREVIPGLRRLAIMANAGLRVATLEMDEVRAAARTVGLEVSPIEIRRGEDIPPAFEALGGRVDALYVVTEALVTFNLAQIVTLALKAKLPTLFNQRDYVKAGGLISYGANYQDQFRRTADFVDKILRGANPPTCRSSSLRSSSW